MSTEHASIGPSVEVPSVPAAFLSAFLGDRAPGHARESTQGPSSSELGSSEPEWFETLGFASRQRGYATRTATLSVREACEASRPGLRLATWDPQRGWVAIIESRQGRARVSDLAGANRWTRISDLERSLSESDGLKRRQWVTVEPGLSGASSPSADSRLSPGRRLLEILRPERSDLMAIVAYAAFIGALSLAIPIAVQQLVNTVALGGLVQPVVVVALLLLAGLTFAAGMTGFQALLTEMLQRRIFVRACIDLARRLPRVRTESLAEYHGPELVNRFFDLITLQKTGARLLLDVSAAFLQTTVGLIVLSFYHPLMLGLSLLLIAAMIAVVVPFSRRATRTAITESGNKYRVAAWMQELARHGRTFRSASSREYVRQRNDSLLSDWVAARQTHYRVVFRQYMSALALQVVANSLILALGGLLVVSGQLTLGQLVASELIVAAVVAAFARLGKQLESLYDVLAAADKVGTLLDLPLETEGSPPPRIDDRGLEIVATSITYRHGEQRIADGLSLRIGAGERVALTGASPQEVRALLDLFSGLRQPEQGFLSIDGRDLRDAPSGWLRENSLCLADLEFFSGSILDNVRIGRMEAPIDEVDSALRRVGILDEIRALPKGLGTPLGTHGAPLSGAQLTRLLVARALVARPGILAIDPSILRHEPDPGALLDLLTDRDAPWTLLLASSKDGVAARCDRVIDLDSLANDSTPGDHPSHEGEGHDV